MKLDKIVNSIFNITKSEEESPKPIQKDYKRKFRIILTRIAPLILGRE